MQWGSYRFVNGLLLIASIVGMAFALYLEHVKGLEPCPLCVFQRIGLIAMGLVALVAVIHNPVSNIVKRLYAFLATLAMIWSVGVAARHVWLQHLPPDQVPSCGPGLDYLVDALPLKPFSAGSDRFGRVCHGRLDIFRSVATVLVTGIFLYLVNAMLMAAGT